MPRMVARTQVRDHFLRFGFLSDAEGEIKAHNEAIEHLGRGDFPTIPDLVWNAGKRGRKREIITALRELDQIRDDFHMRPFACLFFF